jgi:hypothetical protein
MNTPMVPKPKRVETIIGDKTYVDSYIEDQIEMIPKRGQ